jgi:hypothetical protein
MRTRTLLLLSGGLGLTAPLVAARRVVSRPVILAVVVAGVLALGAGSAHARGHSDGVNCGDTITTDVKLDRDLVDCPGNGLVIGADNIDLDLNGHTIDGDNVLGCEDFYACDYGSTTPPATTG